MKRAPEVTPPRDGVIAPAHQDTFLAAEGLTIDNGADRTDRDTAQPIAEARPDAAGERSYQDIIRATRWWVLYGTGGFAVLCILIGALEALFGR